MTKLFINNITDLKESQTISFYYFLKKKLLNLISEIEEPIIIDSEKIENSKKLFNKHFQFFWSQLKFIINNFDKFGEENNLINSTIEIYLPYLSIDIINLNNLKLNDNYHIKKKKILFGDLPLLTPNGTFYINKAERIIIQQLIRNPGIYITKNKIELETPKLKIVSTNGDIFNVITNFNFLSNSFNLLDKNFNFEQNEISSNLLLEKEINATDDIKFLNEQKNNEKIYENEEDYNVLPHIGNLGRIHTNRTLNLNIPLEEEFITANEILQVFKFINTNKNTFRFKNNFNNYDNRIIKTLDIVLSKLFIDNLEAFQTILTVECLNAENLVIPPFGISIEDYKEYLEELKEYSLNQINALISVTPEIQFYDQINPLSSLSHNRRFTVLGSTELLKEKLPKKLNKIQLDQYGRICPIETTDGIYAGLITSLALMGRINNISKIEQPYLPFFKNFQQLKSSSIFLSVENEKFFFISFDSKILNKEYIFARKSLSLKKIKKEFLNFLFFSPLQLFSLAISLIPFLEHNDLGRIQMAASMEKQAMPLIYSQFNIIGTSVENSIITSSGFVIKTYSEGLITNLSSHQIESVDQYNQKITYPLIKNTSLNQKILLFYKPSIWLGEKVFNSQVIACGPGSDLGELSLGYNLNVGYIPWEGYNYEDGIVISDQLILNDCLTSAHICEYDMLYRNFLNVVKLKLKFNVNEELTIKLQNNKIYEKLIEFRNIYETKEEIKSNQDKISIRAYTIKLRRIQVGDKLAARYGNKGIVTKIISLLDMPFLKNGLKIDLIFNPLGIPTRMNVGQLFESLLSLSGNFLKTKYKIIPFNEYFVNNNSEILLNQSLKNLVKSKNLNWFFNSKNVGKLNLKDGYFGNYFDNKIVFGKNYIIKLVHLVSEKYQVRQNDKYSGIFGNSKPGKSQKGGQRFGEMETWALEAHGSIFTLQEFLTIKSDSIFMRTKNLFFIKKFVSKRFLSKIDMPQGFSVLLKELQSIGISINLAALNTLKEYQNQNY